MMPSCSNRIAPVKPSRPSSTRRWMRSISPISPSKFILPPLQILSWGIAIQLSHVPSPFTLSPRRGEGDGVRGSVQFFVQRAAHFASQHVDQVLLGSLLHSRHAAEALDEQTAALLADSRQIIELAVQRALRSASP